MKFFFQTFDDRIKPLKSGREYNLISWWSIDQLNLVRDSSRRWKKEELVSREAVELLHTDAIRALRPRREGEDVMDGVLIAGGWDHEHCFLCWRKISPGEDDGDAGYSDGDRAISR